MPLIVLSDGGDLVCCPRVGCCFSARNPGSLRTHTRSCMKPLREPTGTGFSDKVFEDHAPDPFDDPLESMKRPKYTPAAWEDALDGADDGVLDGADCGVRVDSLGPAADGSRERVLAVFAYQYAQNATQHA